MNNGSFEKYLITEPKNAIKIGNGRDEDLFVIGKNDMVIKKKDKSSECSCIQTSFDYKEKQDALIGREGMFEVNMNTIWTFPNGESASADAYIANGHANKLPISFEIIVDEEVVYTSTVIPVGNQIKDIVLDKPLDAGSYNAVCMYYLWNEDGTENSNFGVNIQLVVKE